MSASDLDGDTAFEKILDRYETLVRNEGEQRKRVDDARDAQRQAERERDGARENAGHWKAVAGKHEGTIMSQATRILQLTKALQAAGIDEPPELPALAAIAALDVAKPTGDMPF